MPRTHLPGHYRAMRKFPAELLQKEAFAVLGRFGPFLECRHAFSIARHIVGSFLAADT